MAALDGGIDSRYSDAVAFVGGLKHMPSDQKLHAYGLFKQATAGDCTADRPGFFDMVGGAKWDAWRAHLGLSPAAAQDAYVSFAQGLGLPPPGQPITAGDGSSSGSTGGSGGGGGLMGPVQSTMGELDEGLDSAGAPPRRRHFEGARDELFQAAAEGNVSLLQALIAQAAEDGGGDSAAAAAAVNARDDSGQTPLHWACDRGQAAAAQLLLSFPGADCNAADGEGMAPLHYAVLCDDAAVVRLLLARGADPRQKDASGESPLDAADGAAMLALLRSGAESA